MRARRIHLRVVSLLLVLLPGSCLLVATRSQAGTADGAAPDPVAQIEPGVAASPATVASPGTAASQAAPGAARGAALYAQYCALCHGTEAEGYKADFAPSLVSTTFLATASDAFLTTSIVDGRPGTAMGAYGVRQRGPLDDADVASLISYLRAQRPWVATVTLPPQPLRGDPVRGKTLYGTNCQRCHGDAKSRINAVHLANPTFLASASDEFLRYAVVHGRPPTPMLAWGPILDPQAIEDILSYVRGWQTRGSGEAVQAVPVAAPTLPPMVIHPKGEAPQFTLREERFVPAAQVAAALKEKRRMIIVDARTPADWERAHITGSISIPYYAPSRLDPIPKDGTWVLAYCACPHHASGEIVDELRRRGYAHTAIIDEGILFWEQQGYPMTFAPPPSPGAAAAAAPAPGR